MTIASRDEANLQIGRGFNNPTFNAVILTPDPISRFNTGDVIYVMDCEYVESIPMIIKERTHSE